MKRRSSVPGQWTFLLCLCVLGGCRQDPTTTETQADSSAPVQQPGPSQGTPRERALAAKDALFKQLSTELVAAMSSGGPAAAIEVCRRQAPKIAKEVGRQHGLSIGRTSFKLRNPDNQPPAWAKELVEQRIAEPTFLELENHSTGALLPIRLNAQCLACHGPPEKLADDVKQQLAQRYPNDQATGFQDGDLRGWFWIEVPH